MRIKFTGYLTLRQVMGDQYVRQVEIEKASLKDLLIKMSREIGEDFSRMVIDQESGDISQHIAVLINGRHYTHIPDGLDTQLKDGDEVALFPPIAGGINSNL